MRSAAQSIREVNAVAVIGVKAPLLEISRSHVTVYVGVTPPRVALAQSVVSSSVIVTVSQFFEVPNATAVTVEPSAPVVAPDA